MTAAVPAAAQGNLAAILPATAALHPDRPAVRLDDEELDFAALDELSARAAGYLRALGMAPGDRVALLLPNTPVFAVLYYGILRAGGIVVPMNPMLKAGEVEHCLKDAGATLLFTWHEGSREAAEGARRAGTRHLGVDPGPFTELLRGHEPAPFSTDRSAEDTAVILYTSGTTGQPKGAELTHTNVRRNIDEAVKVLRLGPDDVTFGGLPLFHSFGQVVGLNCAVAVGACLTLLPRFDPARALTVIARHRVTVFLGVPTMYTLMLGLEDRARHDVSSLRVCVSGGSPLPVEVLNGFQADFGCAVLEGYGLSESSPLACINRIDRARVPGTIGCPIDGVEMRVVDKEGKEVPDGEIGEIVIRGHNVMKGYWRRPEATATTVRDGWLHTGDLGTRDAAGDFRVVDRSKDVIIRGGFNVYPREVEEVLYQHPAVAEAAVIGVPHPTHGEEVAAAVVLRPGTATTTDDLRDFVRTQVAAFKYPRIVWTTDALPKGATGKILKRTIETPPHLLP
ncbi:long-chain-fatty-acid--CoA ligase [Streptomyces venezuelae]|uniref:long-chain-fatty-acid--CoA ligase n=1 Tax=Streptomyces venezuelae TaxID=54571 RepID=UPI00123D9E6F|nr:long-chain fatty acid--CoA ligase [Streptomyces venezuelae]QES12070.1 long-chain-fatty-acid--CoA ligase [Streptomyces venezuelae]